MKYITFIKNRDTRMMINLNTVSVIEEYQHNIKSEEFGICVTSEGTMFKFVYNSKAERDNEFNQIQSFMNDGFIKLYVMTGNNVPFYM